MAVLGIFEILFTAFKLDNCVALFLINYIACKLILDFLDSYIYATCTVLYAIIVFSCNRFTQQN